MSDLVSEMVSAFMGSPDGEVWMLGGEAHAGLIKFLEGRDRYSFMEGKRLTAPIDPDEPIFFMGLPLILGRRMPPTAVQLIYHDRLTGCGTFLVVRS